MRSVRLCALAVLVLLGGCMTQSTSPVTNKQGIDTLEAAKTRLSLGITYLKNGNFKQAKLNLDKALQFAPDLSDVHFSLGYYYQVVGEIAQAKQAYMHALQLDPANADLANTYGAFMCQQGDYEQAKKYFMQAINIPSYIRVAESYENLALCAQTEGVDEEAIAYLKRAIKHEPGRRKSTLLLLNLLVEQQQYEQANELLNQFEKVGSVSADTLWYRVKIERGLGRVDSADAYGKMLLQMYPSHPNSQAFIKQYQQIGVTAAKPHSELPKPVNTEQATESEPTLNANVESETATHVVQKGENLYRISLQYNIRLSSLIEWNNLPDDGSVKVGTTLRLTAPENNLEQ